MKRWALGCFAALLMGCAASPAPTPPAKAGSAPALLKLNLPAGVPLYDSRAAPGAAVGGDAQEVERALLEIAKSSNAQLEGDGRLARLGEFILSVYETHGRPPSSSSVDACARHLGLTEPVPLYMIFGRERDGSWATALDAMVRDLPHSLKYNRYGVAVVPHAGQPLAVSVLSNSSAEIDPIARQTEPGAATTLRGSLRDPYRNALVEVTRPDGNVDHIGEASGTSFRFAVSLKAKGIHRVEILAQGPYGAEVLANFPIYAGVREPTAVSEAQTVESGKEASDAHVVEVTLLALLNQARKEAGVPPLASHAGLAEVATLHSRDMVESGFFGHDSPVNGDPATRVHRKGWAFALIAENVGRGSTAQEVNAMLLDSPGHRANALDPTLTHVGIGVVVDTRQGRSEIVATEDFGGVARAIDVNTAPAEVVNIINGRRAAAGAKPLAVDQLLAGAASRGAGQFFAKPTLTQQDVVSWVNGELVDPVQGASPIGKRMRAAQSFLVPLISMDRLPDLEPTVDPAARYIGVGVAQGPRPDTGPNTIAVVIVVGWPR
jgi:uncharacterized protein YkwD